MIVTCPGPSTVTVSWAGAARVIVTADGWLSQRQTLSKASTTPQAMP